MFSYIILVTYHFFSCSGGVAAHAPEAYLAHSRFRPTTEAYSQGKFLTNAAQNRSYPKSARYGRAGIRTHDPVVGYLVWLWAAFLAAHVCNVPDGSDRPTTIVSKVGAEATVECKSSYKPRQPQPSSNISRPLARDYSPCKGGQLKIWISMMYRHQKVTLDLSSRAKKMYPPNRTVDHLRHDACRIWEASNSRNTLY